MRGVKCPLCDSWVERMTTRKTSEGVTRRYQCANEHRFNTHERVDMRSVIVAAPQTSERMLDDGQD